MGPEITDYVKFLADARDAVYRLNCDQNTACELAEEERRREQELETAGRSVADSVNQTVRKRLEDMNSSYDKEIARGQDRLRRVRAKREKAKSLGVKDRIAGETKELKEHNQDLKRQLGALFHKEGVPRLCGTTVYYALYYPGGFKEILLFLLVAAACFLAVPWGVYFLILGGSSLWHLALVYFLDVVLFGGLYVLVGKRTRLLHQAALKQGKAIRRTRRSNLRKIRAITHAIRRDCNEDLYGLEKYDDEIARTEQELSGIVSKKREALNTFEHVTKNIISDEIIASHKERLDCLKEALDDASQTLKELETSIKEQNIYITDAYGPYLGKAFLEPERISELFRMIQSGAASNITEAVAAYGEGGED